MSAGEFLEHVTYAGNRYGTLRSEIDRILAAGRSPVVEIELAGARAVRANDPRRGLGLHHAALARRSWRAGSSAAAPTREGEIAAAPARPAAWSSRR